MFSDTVAIGTNSQAEGNAALAIGPSAIVTGSSGSGIAIGAVATAQNGGMAIGSGANSGNGTAIIQGLPDRLNNNLALGDSATVKDNTNFNVALGSFSTAGDADLTAAAYKPAGVSTVAGDVGEQNVKIGEVSLGGDVSNWDGAEKMYRRLTNLAAGSADTDGVNVSQLKAVQAAVAGGEQQFGCAYRASERRSQRRHSIGHGGGSATGLSARKKHDCRFSKHISRPAGLCRWYFHYFRQRQLGN